MGVEYHAIYEPDAAGWTRGSLQELPGVITCAPTLEQARESQRDALAEWLAALTSDEHAAIRATATRETLVVTVA